MTEQVDVLSAIAIRGIATVISRIISPTVKAQNPYDAHMDSINRRLALIEQREAEGKTLKTQSPAPVTKSPAMKAAQTATPKTVDFDRDEVGVACLACARAHFATIAGTLKEALRFAREDEKVGILHPEVQTRLQTAEEDVTVIERHDWTPEKIMASPANEQEVIRDMLQGLRELRQDIVQIDSVNALETSAARAAEMSNELRLQVLKTKGLDSDRIIDLARKVENGELSLEQAKQQLHQAVTG